MEQAEWETRKSTREKKKTNNKDPEYMKCRERKEEEGEKRCVQAREKEADDEDSGYTKSRVESRDKKEVYKTEEEDQYREEWKPEDTRAWEGR